MSQARLRAQIDPYETPVEPPLVSGTSLVIIGAFLFGMLCSRLVETGMEALMPLSAVVGFFAYMGFEALVRRRRSCRTAQRRRRVVRKLEKTFDRHLAHASVVRGRTRPRRANPNESQYVTVVTRRAHR